MINKGQGTQQISCHIMLESYQSSRYLAGRRGRLALWPRGLIPQNARPAGRETEVVNPRLQVWSPETAGSPDPQQEEQSGLVMKHPTGRPQLACPALNPPDGLG